ncbi:MAG: carboxylesterase family protein, partial [Proteobacteria bacterium]|nr:carboxylesterase family protein [Pseudomonadota bacterium]
MSIVETTHGKVQGQLIQGLHAFLNIPFAAPPTGELRWSAPVDPQPWSGVRETTAWGKQSWQAALQDMGPLGFAFNSRPTDAHDEDCLNLNVWTPAPDTRKRPV